MDAKAGIADPDRLRPAGQAILVGWASHLRTWAITWIAAALSGTSSGDLWAAASAPS
jgi:hypothetical protein